MDIVFLNLKEPFMHQLIPVLEGIMADFYPEISKEKDFIVNVIKEEEENFLKTLETGINKIRWQHKGKKYKW